MGRTSPIQTIFSTIEIAIQTAAWQEAQTPQRRALMLTTALCDALDGPRGVYIPHPDAARMLISRLDTYAAIRAQFNGANHAELAKRHGVSERQVRRIVDRRRP